MRKLLYMAGVSLALGNMTPAQALSVLEPEEPAPLAEDASEAQKVGLEFLKTTSEMWFLLSGIGSKEDADKAAYRFTELVKRTFELDSQLSALPLVTPDTECVGMMDSVQLRILESMDDLHAEFLGICRARCYGSTRLVKAFEQAVKMGMFAESDAELLHEPADPLSDEESQAEMARIRRLLEPDKAVLEVLEEVNDEDDAAEAVRELHLLSIRFKSLLPETGVANREFSPAFKPAAQTVMAPLEPVLWSIRSEIVRIAALPGYEAETYDEFSNALDVVFETLCVTHAQLFDSVFDASFRADLDNALRENSISSH